MKAMLLEEGVYEVTVRGKIILTVLDGVPRVVIPDETEFEVESKRPPVHYNKRKEEEQKKD